MKSYDICKASDYVIHVNKNNAVNCYVAISGLKTMQNDLQPNISWIRAPLYDEGGPLFMRVYGNIYRGS